MNYTIPRQNYHVIINFVLSSCSVVYRPWVTQDTESNIDTQVPTQASENERIIKSENHNTSGFFSGGKNAHHGGGYIHILLASIRDLLVA